tara:strand:+ start:168 stop:755 length:588 start_codon:yes stop_codon:yes gene_type:complete
MKFSKIFLVTVIGLVFSLSASEAKKAIELRIAPVGSICLEGQECGSAPAASQSMPSAPSNLPKVELSEGSEHVVKMLNSGNDGTMVFEPAVIKVSLGDTIHFKATDLSHNSASMNGMIPSGAKSWAGSLSQDISVTLDTEGVYVYQCDPHVMMAMVGVIQVGEAVNMDEVMEAAASQKSSFIMNGSRLDQYLSQL